jgi:transporter family-2 protein
MATQQAPATVEHGHRVIGLSAAFLTGVLLAVQSRLNGELGHRLGDGVPAALISFGGGLVLLLVASALVPRIRAGLHRVWTTIRQPAGAGRLRWWQCIGGVAGAFLVATQSITVAVIGVAVFTVAVVSGQTLSSLFVDRLGFGPGGVQPLTWLRVLGAALAMVAVVLAESDRLSHPSGLVLAVLPALAGLGASVQAATNGLVARTASTDAYGALATAVINFAVGTTALTVVFAVDLVVRGTPRPLPDDPWLYVGGACGVAVISISAVVVRVVGVFLLGLGMVAGQLLTSLLLDLVVPAGDNAVTPAVIAGTMLALVAVVVAAFRRPLRPNNS